jgi:hypothetical protein
VRERGIPYGIATLHVLCEMKGDRKFRFFSQNRRTSQTVTLGLFHYVTAD